MFSFRTIWKYLWLLMGRYRFAFFSMFFLIVLRIMFSMLLVPYGYKSIIDVLSLTNLDVQTRANVAFAFIVPMTFGFIGSILVNRYREFIDIRFTSSVIKD